MLLPSVRGSSTAASVPQPAGRAGVTGSERSGEAGHHGHRVEVVRPERSGGRVTGSLVEAAGLYHIYRERDVETVALRGAGLVLEPGSWTSLTGPSGSGKSTLLQILAGLLTPTAGTVLVGGEDLARMAPDERARCRRRRIGVVLQRDNLHPGLDLAANVAIPLRLDGRPARAIRE